MINIPELAVVALGIGAAIKDFYKIFHTGSIKSIGSLVSVLYILLVYIMLYYNTIGHGSPFVRVGITIILLDKVLVFTYDLWTDYGKKLYDCLGIKTKYGPK